MKIQHLDQTFYGGKIPKGSGNFWKVTSGRRSLSHHNGCVTNNSPRDSISAHIFLAGSREGLVLDILQVLLGISGVPPLPNLINSYFKFNLKNTKRQSQNTHSKHMQVHCFYFLLHSKALVIFLFYIHIVSQHCAFVYSSFIPCHLWLSIVKFQTPK